jgi:putative glycerol-1-phosphate prenyltransferase
MSLGVLPVYSKIKAARSSGKKLLSVLVDPDKADKAHISSLVNHTNEIADLYFIGGSILTEDALDETVESLKAQTTVPCVLFPGSAVQISGKADAILFLSLISGRNPDLLIGQHVVSAPRIKHFGLEVLAVGYMLIDGGRPTTASYISHTFPIPSDKPEIAACTAMAGEMLGLGTIYLDAGSGAQNPIPPSIISAVRNSCDIPIIVGGGIRTPEQARMAADAGADIIVIGNAFESNPSLAAEIKSAIVS